MANLVEELRQVFRQQCAACRTECGKSMSELVPANMMSEEQWVGFVQSQRGTDHITDFFMTNFDREILQWFVNKPLSGSSTSTTLLHVEARDRRYAVLSLLLKFGGSFVVSVFTYYNAPINVMPHYSRYGLMWGKVGICIPESNNSPPTGEVLAIQTPTYPDISPSSKTWGKWG